VTAQDLTSDHVGLEPAGWNGRGSVGQPEALSGSLKISFPPFEGLGYPAARGRLPSHGQYRFRLLFPCKTSTAIERYPVKTLIALLSALLLSFPAFAADNACMAQAAEKKLSGAAKNSFTKKCVRDGCEATSLDKKLAGAAKSSFTKKCVADGLQPFCEEQATGKKLSGAAKSSFMNKCQTGD